MRKELEQMDRVEGYLAGRLSDRERTEFEMELSKDPALQEVVADHRLLLRGMERLALRPAINSAYRRYQFLKWAPWIGGAVLIALFVAGSVILLPAGETAVESGTPVTDQPTDTGSEGVPAVEVPEEQHTLILDAQGETLDTLKPAVSTTTAPRKEIRIKRATSRQDEVVQVEDTVPTTSEEVPAGSINDYAVGVRNVAPSTPPMFPGGDDEMRKFIYGNLVVPKAADGSPIDDMVTVRFTIMADGSVDHVRVRTGSHEETRAEAERLIRMMPDWIPATRMGVNFPAEMELPIVFMSTMEKMD